MKKPANFEEYIIPFPENTQRKLVQLHNIIIKTAPEAEELISYGMPAFRLNGMLLYFAGFKNHIGFYPFPSTITAFSDVLSEYKFAAGSVQFPLSKPLPLKLITRMVKFRVTENLQKAKPVKRVKK